MHMKLQFLCAFEFLVFFIFNKFENKYVWSQETDNDCP